MDDRGGHGPEPKGRSDRDVSKPDRASLAARYSGPLRSFLEAVSATLEELRQDVPGLTLSMKKDPGEILSMLPMFLHVQQMSLLEVQYVLTGTSKRPGIRFWFEGSETDKRLRAVLFEDTRIWEVSYNLQKRSTELGTFFLGDGEILAYAAPPLSGKPAVGSHWKAFLRDVLRAPISCATAKGRTENV